MTQIYQRLILSTVFTVVSILLVTAWISPPKDIITTPKAVLVMPQILAVKSPTIAPKFVPVLARGSEALLDGGNVRRADAGHVITPVNSVAALERTFFKMGYDLKLIGAGQANVPRVFLASMPGDIDQVRESKKRKELFFRAVLPLVLQVNEEITRDRKRLSDLIAAKNSGYKTGPIDRLWLIVMAERYRSKSGDLNALIKRVDVIPPSLALAQAAEESGWGTSRFVREGNAMFGQWTTENSEQSIVPNTRDENKTHRIKAFDSLLQSVRAYARNLNTHRAYRHLRTKRHQLRTDGNPLDGMTLAEQLTSYSERGEKYVKTLRSIIGTNNLRKFDDAQLIQTIDKRPFI